MKKLLPLCIASLLGTLATTTANADDIIQIYQLAKESDPTILQAAATKDSAFAAIGTSRASLLPQIDLSASYTLNRYSNQTQSALNNDTNILNGNIGLTQQLFNSQSWVNLDITEILARQADAVYASAQQDLILRVANAYFDVLSALDDLGFVRSEKKAVGRQLEQTKQRFEVGLSAITDVYDAQAQYDSVLANEILAENTVANNFEELREITGQSHKDLSVLNTKTFTASRPRERVEVLVKEAEQLNLTLLAARIAKDASKRRIDLANTGHLPTLSLNASYGLTDRNDQTNNAANSKYNQFTGGINFSLPLYSGGSVVSQSKEAEYNFVAASEALESNYRTVMKNVRAFYNDINANIGALKAFQQTVVSAQSALEATEAGFEVGTRTIVDVLDATTFLFEANRNLSSARYDYILSVLQLRQAQGVLTENDLVEINNGLIASTN